MDEYLRQLPYEQLAPEIAGTSIVTVLQQDATSLERAYLLNGSGLQQLP